uniref:Uncharacterized protein n=1 Tax=Avena sativa TaxID=4498 RepID=A0ACD5UKJ8_AVESA
MLNENGSSSRSTKQLSTPATGSLRLKGLLSGGAGGGDKPPRHPWRIKSMHELDGTARGGNRPAVPTTAVCSFCESFYLSEEDLRCHIRRCHVHRSWRRGKEEAPRPLPSVTERYVFEKRPSPGGHRCSSSHTGKKGLSMPSKQQQLADDAIPAEAPVKPAFDLNVPAPEVEEEKRSSG